MSYYFTISGDDVWDPALQTGLLYVALTEKVASMLGVDSGLKPAENDTCEVDSIAFSRFIDSLSEFYGASRHPVRKELIEGLLLTSLVIAERGSIAIPETLKDNSALREKIGEISKSM
ncbi:MULTISPECIES: DUF6086 family protein [unclassified Micromonospora]|uniref:DUF6086 family protein n=1 Tax=unclassified Micromonospora TaxID=2617518 RepID=UPI003A8C51BF